MSVQNPYDDSVIKGAGWTNETLKAIKEFVDTLETIVGTEGGVALANKLTAARAALLPNLDAAISSRAVPGDAMTLTAAYNAAKTAAQAGDAMALVAAAIIAIRQSVCAGGDPAGSIGKLLNDYLDAAVSSRAAAATALSIATWTAALAAELEPTAKGKSQIKATTIDLGQIAGTYDLFTATTQDVVVEKVVIRMSGGTLVGSNLTSILIQTDDATPQVFISAAQGAVANLTDEAQLAWTGAILLDAGTSAKIRLTIAGGAATAAKICDVIAECRAVVAGGYLA